MKFPFFLVSSLILFFLYLGWQKEKKNAEDCSIECNYGRLLFFFLITDCFSVALSFSKNSSFMWKEVAARLLELF